MGTVGGAPPVRFRPFETTMVLQTTTWDNSRVDCEFVDHRGFAPRTAGCKPADLLTNRVAQNLARRPGAAPDPSGFGDRTAHWRPPRVDMNENWCG